MVNTVTHTPLGVVPYVAAGITAATVWPPALLVIAVLGLYFRRNLWATLVTWLSLRCRLWAWRRQPDRRIDRDGEDYLLRWYLLRRNRFFNVYLHVFLDSDGPVLHDHPWWSLSLTLDGTYREDTPGGSYHRQTGDLVLRSPTKAHRIVLHEVDGKRQPAMTLFVTGPIQRVWGFLCPSGWTSYREHMASGGCGEHHD